MSGLTSFLFNTLSTALFGSTMETTTTPLPSHEPSIEDVFAVKNALFKKFKLPLEIIDVVVDFAEYWAHTSTSRTGGLEITVRAGRPLTENQFILRSYPLGYVPTQDNSKTCSMSDTEKYPTITPRPWLLPEDFPTDATAEVTAQIQKNAQIRGEHPCRKVVFTIKSHDQGWGGTRDQRGTYKGSYTWFEAGQERLTAFKDTHYISASQDAPPTGVENPKTKEIMDKWPIRDLDMEMLPQFAFPLDTENASKGRKTAEDLPTICTVRTLSPRIESRETAHEPPQNESWFSHALMPSNDCIQKNLTAHKESQANKITWRHDDDTNPESLEAKKLDDRGRGPASKTGEYVRNLKVGDVVTVWAKARFPMWVNTVEEVKIDVYWAV